MIEQAHGSTDCYLLHGYLQRVRRPVAELEACALISCYLHCSLSSSGLRCHASREHDPLRLSILQTTERYTF